MRAADRRERRFRRVQNQERMTDQYSSYYLQVLLEAASQESVRPIRSIDGTSAKSMGGRVPLMKCGPVCTPGYLAETSGQLPPGGTLKHVDLVAAGRLVDLADPSRCRTIRSHVARRKGNSLDACAIVGDQKPHTT